MLLGEFVLDAQSLLLTCFIAKFILAFLSLSHDRYEHIEDHDLCHKCCKQEIKMRQEVLNADPSFLLRQVVIFVAHQTQAAEVAKNKQVHVEEALEVVIAVVVIRRI